LQPETNKNTGIFSVPYQVKSDIKNSFFALLKQTVFIPKNLITDNQIAVLYPSAKSETV